MTSLMLSAALALVALFAGWRGARPPDFKKGPRMIPWRAIMVSSAAGAVMVGAHVAVLMGLVTPR